MRRREEPYDHPNRARIIDPAPGPGPGPGPRRRPVVLLGLLTVVATASTALAWQGQEPAPPPASAPYASPSGPGPGPHRTTSGGTGPDGTGPDGAGPRPVTRTVTATATRTATAVGPSPTRSGTDGGSAAPTFVTLPPGSPLPTGQHCTELLDAHPAPETLPANAAANSRTGHRLAADAVDTGGTGRRARHLMARVDGRFTGSTQDVLRWGACKWGLDEQVVSALAQVQSSWRQDKVDDWRSDPDGCPPGHAPGADGRAGLCPQAHGIMQVRYPYARSAFPGAERSTAMNVDTALAIVRSCYEGYEKRLDDVERSRPYGAGDLWGCVGRWYTGRWCTRSSLGCLTRVRSAVRALPDSAHGAGTRGSPPASDPPTAAVTDVPARIGRDPDPADEDTGPQDGEPPA